MAFDEITISITTMDMSVVLGKLKGARLCWNAPGLNIYVRGAMPVKVYAHVANIACEQAIARGIRCVNLKRAGR